jgi:hypothetical protein
MMSLLNDHNLRILNLFLTGATILPSAILFLRTLSGTTTFKEVKWILLYIFISFFISSILSTYINIHLLFILSSEELMPIANLRNFFKNSAIFIMAWGFLRIEFKRR